MKVFTNVVAQGGFTAASKYLHMTPQMVSHHIKQLEKHLGVSLFSRTTRKVNLTHVGQQYLAHCTDILLKVESSEASVRESANTPSGLLRVCAPVTFGSIKIAPALVEFSKRYPSIQVDLSLSDQRQDLMAENLDIAFRIGKLSDSNLIARPLQDYSMMLAASPKYLSENGNPNSIEDLKNHQCLLQRFDQTGTQWKVNNHDELSTVNVNGNVRVDHGAALLNCALADGGIILQPKVLLEQAIHSGALIPILIKTPLPQQPMHLLYQSTAKKDAKAMAFIQFALTQWQ
jgi:DNA-binding transcriptional LysR family regulator